MNGGGGGDSGVGAGDAAESSSDDSGDEGNAEELPRQGPNALSAKLERALTSVRAHAGHIVYVDRGLADMAGLNKARALGFHSTALMQFNRRGLPRRYLAQLQQQLRCPRGCKHGADAAACNRWRWVVLHKNQWELVAWLDGKRLVVSVSDCASATRSIQLHRTVGSAVLAVSAPEPIGLYNLLGRGGVDTGDQHRKAISLAGRRQCRQGPKGALFDFEIALTNGHAIAGLLRPGVAVTQWAFCEEFANDVLAKVSARTVQRVASQLQGDQGRAASTRARKHMPTRPVAENRKRRRVLGDGPARWCGRGSTCCEAPTCDEGEPVRAEVYCPGCAAQEGCSGWYHLACWSRVHTCEYSKD